MTCRLLTYSIKANILFSYAFWRLFNAGAILFSGSVSALIVGAGEWAHAGLTQTIFSYLIFFSLGINEGIGQRIVTNREYFEPVFQRLRLTFISLSIFTLLLYIFLIRFDITLLLYLSGASSLLLFILGRLYYRGTGVLNGLSILYMTNGFIMLFSPVLVFYTNNSLSYIYIFIIASVISSELVKLTLNKSNQAINENNNEENKVTIDKLKELISVGFPIMLSGLVFEIIITLDRFYINKFSDAGIVGNISLSMLLVKGAIMGMGILTTYKFRQFSKCVIDRNIFRLKSIYRKYYCIAVSGSILFVTAVYLILSSNTFLSNFPSYEQLPKVFIYHSLVLIPLAFIFPLGIISNFRFGGGSYLAAQLGALFIYIIIISILHLFVGMLSTQQLSISVFISFSLSAIVMNNYVFKMFLRKYES